MAPPPVKLNLSSTSSSSAAANQNISTTSLDARLLVRETMRISANLASSPSPTPIHSAVLPLECRSSGVSPGLVQSEFVESNLRLICSEDIDGRRWNYLAENATGGSGGGRNGGLRKNSIRAICIDKPQAPTEELMAFIRSYVVPEGFPDSVTASYVPYMSWRALKHFFGGAISVFTTQTLLSSVGVSTSNSASGAVAINWILKDGAGRVGKMLFARQGKKFDYDLKQLRFAGDILMDLGAGVELATAAMPHLFLPLACAANVAKNVAAVTSTSTRTPIYKAFAKGENIGDVTAKGESVGNIADLLGTGMSIMISRRNPSLISTFAFLSCGYVLSSYQEIRSLVLHTLNRARFTVAVESFLKTGRVPSLEEGNMKETIFRLPWLKDKPVVLGSRFKDAFHDPAPYLALEPFFQKERYMVAYNPKKRKVYVLLKDQAKSDDIIKAAFHGHVLLDFIDSAVKSQYFQGREANDQFDSIATSIDIEAHVAESCKVVSTAYGLFKSKAAEQGWVMSDSLLNPGRARILS
ncbi:Protein root UVB sensitive 6 [Dionaea muscipula]